MKNQILRRVVAGCLTGLLLALALAGCGADNSSKTADAESTSENADSLDKTEEKESDMGSAEKGMDPVSIDVFAMDTYMTLTAYGTNAEAALGKAEAEIHRIDDLLSTGNPDSEVSLINREKDAEVSDDTFYLVSRSVDFNRLTDGLFDISIYPVMREWGFTDSSFHVPDADTLSGLLQHVDASKIELDAAEQRVTLPEQEMEIDLGGIAKGFTSDRVIEILAGEGVDAAVISLGGNVKTYGQKPDGSSWKVAVESPNGDGGFTGILSIGEKAVITSGGYQRYFEEDGTTYHHIIDPRTGVPAKNGLISVSIITEDGTMGDALSTSLFIMGLEKAVNYWAAHKTEFDMVLVDDDNQIWVSEGIADVFVSEHEFNIVKTKEKNT